jgi:hypothetical protein
MARRAHAPACGVSQRNHPPNGASPRTARLQRALLTCGSADTAGATLPAARSIVVLLRCTGPSGAGSAASLRETRCPRLPRAGCVHHPHLGAGERLRGSFRIRGIPILWRPVKLLVHAGVAQDGLDILAGLGEGDGLDELLRVAIFPLAQPVIDAV